MAYDNITLLQLGREVRVWACVFPGSKKEYAYKAPKDLELHAGQFVVVHKEGGRLPTGAYVHG